VRNQRVQVQRAVRLGAVQKIVTPQIVMCVVINVNSSTATRRQRSAHSPPGHDAVLPLPR
jgi:hypothetical protein